MKILHWLVSSILKHTIHRLSLCKALAVFVIIITAQVGYSQQLLFKRIHESTGLKSDHVQDITQDKDGYIWISTYEGIVKYDGIKYIPPSKSEEWPVATNPGKLLIDCENKLWVFSPDTCLFYANNINSNNPSFALFPEIKNPVKGILVNSCIIYVANKYSIYKIRNNKIIQRIKLLPDNQSAVITDMFYHNQTIYATSSGKGLFIINCNNNNIQKINREDGLLSDTCTAVSFIENAIWVGQNNGFTTVNSNKEFKKVSLTDKVQVNFIIQDKTNQIWISTSNGLRIYNHNKLIHLYNAYNNLLTSQFFTKTFFDRENNIWLTTSRGGIYFINNYYLQKFPPTFDEIQPVFGMEQQNDTTYWIGHFGMGILGKYKINLPALDYDTILHSTFDATTCAKDTIGSNIYFVGYYGISEISSNGIKTYTNYNTFSHPHLKSVWFNGNDTSIYIGSKNGVMKLREGKIKKLTHTIVNDLIVNQGLCAGNYHLIATNDGIKQIKNDSIVNLPLFDPIYAKDRNIKVLVKDPNQNIWSDIGSNRVLKINTVGNRLNYCIYNLNEILGISGPYNFFFFKNIGWLRTFDKIYMYDLSQINQGHIHLINTLDKFDGLIREAPYEAGMFMDNKEQLWLYGNYGIYKYDYQLNLKNGVENKTHLEKIRVNEKIIDLSKYSDSLSPETGLPIHLRLPHALNELKFEYIGLCFKSPEEVSYRTKLIGLKNEWSPSTQEAHVTYNNLSPGNYTFQVISCNNDGVWNKDPYSFSFIILPAWYQTWWFKLIMSIVFAGIIYILFLLRINKLKKDKHRQEKLTQDILQSQEQERKRIAQELHDGVGQELSMLKVNVERMENTPVLDKVNKIIEDIRFLSRNIHPHYFEKLGLTRAVEMIVDENTKMGKIFWVHELENIDTYLNTNQQLMLFRIIQECMNNTIKHSGAKNGKVTISITKQEITILIQDNGIGFNVDQTKLNSLGLSTIKERVKALNGSLSIKSKPGSGSISEIVLPIS